MKICIKCNKEKNEIEFQDSDKYGNVCISCGNEYRKLWKRNFRSKRIKKCISCKEVKDLEMFLKIGKGYSELCINCYKTHAPKDKNTNTLNALLVLEGKCKCGICKQIKPMIVFVKSNHTISGYKSICKKCFNIVHKRNRIKKSYGITIENLDYLLRKQNSLCKICNNEITFIKEKNKRRGCIDHNHKNKKVRGLLCDHCNRAIGLLGDDTNILYAAIRYLKSDHVKLGELLENPEVDNQQPNLGSE